ncbi:Chitotriosidase-1 [Paramyrothecium foliicola]|nr:Chitotriosidase-1 [Paramyrothecium foliicola]
MVRACCPKETGWCNYGPEACGTNNISPNDVCWSNCDAKAECGRFAASPGKECPLNVCCSPFGFCGMTEEFCKVTDDEEESCQSNCEQPGSGSSGGNVRDRIVGYYEAWVHDRKCNGMSINQIPVGALTHLMFSFAYITPGDFQIVPMDDLDPSLFRDMAAMKRKNKALKVMVALGGWTFNDPGPNQRVFHDVASTKENRAKFIGNLLSFLRQYAFDGVDFDWEYPGAEDRGGQEGDGKRFTLLLEELRDAINEQPLDYVVSFTTPTSYWYLRHFDIKGSTDAVDFVNIMSYDLHGVWDAQNPIGSNVLAHTNLTEIKLALDLYWRNDIDPKKLNLGFGFYGRSFTLADPTCYKPGCRFSGGADPGPCTKNSGTLAYREIKNIIDDNDLKPYYEKEHEVKYIVWNENQWVSYDDEETIRGKLEFANDLGIGGLLIWSVDQDTDDLEALSAVVGPNIANLLLANRRAEDTSFWQDMGAQDCYVTDCGGKCNTGFKEITNQPCGDATFLFRHSTEDNSKLCCPLSAAPDPEDCRWRSSAPECNGRCEPGEVGLQLNKWGDGAYCENGHKMYCCETALERENKCYFAADGKMCKSGEEPLTWSGKFTRDYDALEELYDLKGSALLRALEDYDLSDTSLYCCPKEDLDRWDNCEWRGSPDQGNCFDGHCNLNTQIEVTWAGSGGGRSCGGIDPGRIRVFCCDPPGGETLFLPVSLENLFPEPPEGDDVKTDFDLNIDNTWGDGEPDNNSEDDPNDASFQFYVLASPTEIQVSLDKRDGSHWELFNCFDSVSDSKQTVQMICTDVSENSTCSDIHKGNGVPGTIIQMPQGQGCGPGKYAVATSLEISKNQTLPRHLSKRNFGHTPTVYDLTFDYDFTLVPREFGDTQMRIDFSNQEGYWDTVVAAPSSKKSKRSLSDFNGNHRRWLEEEWRDDFHFGALDHTELRKRWFGDDAIEWLKQLLHIDVRIEKKHDYEEEMSIIILQEEWECGNFKAKVDAVATAGIQLSTSFGITIITTLGPDMDLSKSFIHFNNEGNIEAVFTLDALMKMDWDSDVFTITPIPIPGGTWTIYGIATSEFGSTTSETFELTWTLVGPRFDLNARFRAGVSLEGRIEAKAEMANWRIRQTYPQQDGYEPEEEEAVRRQFPKDGIAEPQFDASITANGYAEAHILPTLAFGIKFDDRWDIDPADVSLVADLYGRVRAKSDLLGGDCLFGYNVEAGVKLTAEAHVPDIFQWHPSPFTFGELNKRIIPDGNDEWECLTGETSRRDLGAAQNFNSSSSKHSLIGKGLQKRLTPYGPVIKLPKLEKLCPSRGGEAGSGECLEIFAVDDFYDSYVDDSTSWTKRQDRSSVEVLSERSNLDPRAVGKGDLKICETHGFHIKAWARQTQFDAWDGEWGDCNDYSFVNVGARRQQVPMPNRGNNPRNEDYAVEHVLEAQLLSQFLTQGFSDVCDDMGEANSGWYDDTAMPPVVPNARTRSPWQFIADAFPYRSARDTRNGPNYPAHHEDEFITVIQPINQVKASAFAGANALPGSDGMADAVRSEQTVERAIRTMKNVLLTYKYLNLQFVKDTLVAQATRVGDRMDEAEDFLRNDPRFTSDIQGLRGLWLSFVKGRTELAVSKMSTFLTLWLPEIERVLDNTDPAQDTPARATIRTKIERLRDAVDNRGRWSSPFRFV